MKRIFFMIATAILFSCGSSNNASHDHQSEGHDHASESHAHDGEEGHDHSEVAKSEPGDAHDDEGGITLSAKQAQALGLTYEVAKLGDFSAAVRVSGVIEPSSNDNFSIVANVSGIVKISQSGLNIGIPVGNGAKLFVIEAGSLAQNNVGSRVAIAKAALDKAQADYNRLKSLQTDAMATAWQMEEAKLALETAKKNYEALSRSQAIVSPIGGYVTSLDVKNGDFVNEGVTLATVSSGKNLVIRGDLPSKYFGLLSKINSANFLTPYNNQIYSLAELNGRLLSKGNTVSGGSYTVPVLFSVSNRASLIAGTTIDVFLLTGVENGVISVPATSLTEEQGAFYVYIRTCADSYAKVLVRVGDSNGERVEITEGLHVGDNVVTNGAYFVRLASASSSIPQGHSH